MRRDLGGDAVILASREVRRRRLFGLGAQRPDRGHGLGHHARGAAAGRPPGEADDRSPERRLPRSLSASSQARFGEQLSRLHAMVETLSRQGRIDHLLPDLPGELVPSYAQLVEAEVPEILARRLVRHRRREPRARPASATRKSIQAALCEAVGQCIPIAPPIRAVAGTRRVVALVGPTGVGKTTTVAKLAANFKLVHGLRVGLVTVDTYRIAAVEQLKTYAEIIDLPLAVANDPGQMSQAIDELGAVDLVFIDTAGRSPRDEVKIRELAEFMAQARPDEVHLVLSAGATERTLRSAVERFAQVRADRLILTKLDEAESLGAVLGVLGQANRPVSYLTTGQAVPDDIEPADRKRLARLVLGWEAIG